MENKKEKLILENRTPFSHLRNREMIKNNVILEIQVGKPPRNMKDIFKYKRG